MMDLSWHLRARHAAATTDFTHEGFATATLFDGTAPYSADARVQVYVRPETAAAARAFARALNDAADLLDPQPVDVPFIPAPEYRAPNLT